MKAFSRIAALILALAACAAGAHAQTWNIQIVDDAGDTGYDTQVAVDGDGIPFIFYKSTSQAMFLAYWVPGGGDTGGWQYVTLEGNTPLGYTYEVLVGSDGLFRIAYCRTNGVRYGIFNPATKTWTLGPETVTGAPAYSHVDLALTTIGPDIVPVLSVNQDGQKVFVYKRDPGTGVWTSSQVSTLHNATRASSIAIDSAQNMHVSFYEPSGLNLMYATKSWNDAVWQTSTVDLTGNIGEYSSIAVTPDDQVHIVYYDATNGDLKYAALNP